MWELTPVFQVRKIQGSQNPITYQVLNKKLYSVSARTGHNSLNKATENNAITQAYMELSYSYK